MTYLLNSYIKILERDLYLERSFLGQTRLESMESNTARKCFLNKTYKKILLNKTIQNAPFRHYQISKLFQNFEYRARNDESFHFSFLTKVFTVQKFASKLSILSIFITYPQFSIFIV